MEEKVYRTELTPVSFLERSASVFPEKTAIVHGDRHYTYREFAGRVYRLASHLRESGLRKARPGCFSVPQHAGPARAHFAVPAAGGILVAINTRLNAQEIDFILTHSGVRFLFVDAELFHVIEPLNSRRACWWCGSTIPAHPKIPMKRFLQPGHLRQSRVGCKTRKRRSRLTIRQARQATPKVSCIPIVERILTH